MALPTRPPHAAWIFSALQSSRDRSRLGREHVPPRRMLTHTRPRLRPHGAPNTATGTLPSATRCGRRRRAPWPRPGGSWQLPGRHVRLLPALVLAGGPAWQREPQPTVAAERPAASTCPLPADFALFFVTPAGGRRPLWAQPESPAPEHMAPSRGPGAAWPGRSGESRRSSPAARWGPRSSRRHMGEVSRRVGGGWPEGSRRAGEGSWRAEGRERPRQSPAEKAGRDWTSRAGRRVVHPPVSAGPTWTVGLGTTGKTHVWSVAVGGHGTRDGAQGQAGTPHGADSGVQV